MFMWYPNVVLAQLSPGELAKPHAFLEGLTNCTQCHELGDHVNDRRCLDCHQEIQTRLDASQGFHATVRDTNCIACHSDHNGRAFNMIRWPDEDVKKFNHDRTGYVLKGKKHVAAACRDCHQAKNITDQVIKTHKKKDLNHTFLGLDTSCQSCHEDIHRDQFDQSCEACHSVDDWKDVSLFSHDQARFALVGKHSQVGCEKCHPTERVSQGSVVSFTRYKPVAFEACASCHEDVHRGRFVQTCDACHSPEGWYQTDRAEFNHSRTQFPLIGKHQQVNCQQCHGPTQKLTRPAFGQCSDCHEDVHLGQFAKRSDGGRCDVCHSERGFLPASFGLVDHQKTRFPLTDAHQAVPCMMCHTKNDLGVTRFDWAQEEFLCRDCHTSPHGDQFVGKIAKGGCESCHNASTWRTVSVDHNETRFPLVGKHEGVTCNECHKNVQTESFTGRLFAPLPMNCQDCHVDRHDGQFVRSGITACARCHTSSSWKADKFDHNRDARFSLTGSHQDVTCEKCHTPRVTETGLTDKYYRPIDMTCANCHGDM